MANRKQITGFKIKKRNRLSVDLTPYEDVCRMIERAERAGLTRTRMAIKALRAYLLSENFGRKKDKAL